MMSSTTRPIRRWLHCLSLVLGALTAPPAAAICTITGSSQTEDARTARIAFGRINLSSSYLQPPGTLLASIVVPPTNYTYGGANAETILWKCDLADLPNLYFLVATNGDARIGGHNLVGIPDGLSDVYATWFEYVGIRQRMLDVTFTRYWKPLPLQGYDTGREGNQDKIYIRLKHIPPLVAELYRVSDRPPPPGPRENGFDYADCNPEAKPTPSGRTYTCTQPNSYIQLVGPGIAHDEIGEDSDVRFDFWGADNGFGYGLRATTSFSNTASCVVRTATAQVRFATVSVQQMSAGTQITAPFSVQIECSDASISGTASGQTAIGLQVSTGALAAAQTLGLVNSAGGVDYLLSDQYGSDGIAGGVGISLYGSDHQRRYFLGAGASGFNHPKGPQAGWNPAIQGAVAIGSSSPGYGNWRIDYSAILERLPGVPVTPGKIHATANVLVKVQ